MSDAIDAKRSDPDLDRLIVAYLTGEADVELLAELDRRLIADQAAVARLAWWGRQDLALRGLGTPVGGAATNAPASGHRGPSKRPVHRAPPSMRWGFAAIAASLLALAGWWWTTLARRADAPTAVAVVRSSTGEATVSHGGSHGGGARLAPGTVLVDGDALTCGGDLTIDYPDGTAVAFGPGSAATISTAAGKQLQLERGTLRAAAAKQPAGSPMRILTAQAETTVVGTRFALAATPAATRLEVESGAVRFTRLADGVAIEVGAGHEATAGPEPGLIARPLQREAVDMALKRPASASSSFVGKAGDPHLHTPAQANDGDPSTCWGTAVDRRGLPDPRCWWQVDLGEPCRVERIELMARQDEFDQRDTRATFEIRGGDRADGSDSVLLARHQGDPFAHRGTWSATVDVATPVRFVRVVQLAAGYMGMAEVRVIGRPASMPPMPPWPDAPTGSSP